MAWLLRAECVQVWLRDSSARVLRLAAQFPADGIPPDAQIRARGSIVGAALHSAEPLLTGEVGPHPFCWEAASRANPPRSGLFVPVRHADRPLAVLVALSPRHGAFARGDVEVVQALGAQVAAAILSARLYAEARDQARRLATIMDVNKRLALGPDREELFARLADGAAHLLGVDGAGVRLVEGGALVRAAGFGSAAAIIVRERLRPGESMCGRVVAEVRTITSANLAREPRCDPEVRARARAAGGCAWLGAPLRWHGRVLGALFVTHRGTRRFDQADRRLLEAFADQAAIAIANARLLEQEQAQRKQLEAVRDVTVEIARELDLSAVLALAIRRAVELVAASSGVIRLLDEPSGLLLPSASHGRGERGGELEVKLGAGVTGTVGQHRRGMIVNDYGASPYARPFFPYRPRGVAILAEPILSQDRLVGVITVSKAGAARPFSEQDREILSTFAGQAAIAIENARLYRELADRERRLHELVGRLLQSQEEERRRVAYDVHDGLAQVAAAAHQHLEALASHYRPRSPRARQELDLARELAQRTVREARQIIADLRPTALDDFGLAAALGLEVDALRAQGWQVTYDEALGPERLPPTVEAALFRVAQEALTNVRKHARTTRVHLALRRDGQIVSLEVRDWGRGFEPQAVLTNARPSERVGLAGMRERVAWLGGRCSVRSHPGAGTRIVAEVPLQST
ncbi:MAG: GAF domain-containing protein [Chloroflexota bacterium]|nr:GAF domain-containing protein [Chloroflexota bacterium]